MNFQAVSLELSKIELAAANSLSTPIIDALSIPEILLAIFEWLSRNDLTIMSRVCRLWISLALDLIWENIDGLRHLINTYSELTEMETEEDSLTCWTFRDVATVGRWDVFSAYAARIHELEISEYEAFAPGVIEHLRCRSESFGGLSSSFTRLRVLDLTLESDGPSIAQTLHLIPPDLRSLEVWSSDYSSRTPEALQGLLEYLMGIRLVRLESLSLIGSGEMADERLSILRDDLLLKSCTTLVSLDISLFSITAQQLQAIGRIIPGLTHLDVDAQNGILSPQEVAEFFDVIGESFQHLRSVRVYLESEGTTKRPFGEIIGGLEPCRDLRKFYIGFSCWNPLTQADILYLGSRWPLVEEFDVYDHPPDTKMPLPLLQDFVRVWSRTLRRLSLRLDTTISPPSSPPTQLKFERLESLDVANSPLRKEDIKATANFIASITTRPVKVISRVAISLSDPPITNWNEVHSLVNAAWAK